MENNTKSTSPHLIYGVIIALLLAGGTYLFLNKNKTEDQLIESQQDNLSLKEDKTMIESEYNAALSRLDEMKTESVQMDSLIAIKSEEVETLKNKIQSILSDKNASDSQLLEAKKMIKQLNDKLSGFEKQIIALKQENIQLSEDKKELITKTEMQQTENEQLKSEKTTLEKTVEKGSVLHASNIRIETINEKKNLLGKKVEKETEKAKKVDLIKLSFNLDDNRISESGEKMIYICLTDQNGSAIGSKKFTTVDGAEKTYTTTKTVPYKQGETSYGITTEFLPSHNFSKGTYQVELYHMGYKIGKQEVSLK
ncbi:MAG: hypothetical protein R2831_03535 [Chitinophagaceae bacterium]